MSLSKPRILWIAYFFSDNLSLAGNILISLDNMSLFLILQRNLLPIVG